MKLLTAAITLLIGVATVVAGDQISFAEGNEAVTPDACVSLLVYKDETCSGSPMRTLTFPTYSRQSGPCCKFIDLKNSRRFEIVNCSPHFFFPTL